MLEAFFIGLAAFAGTLSQRAVGFGVPLFLVPVLLVYFSAPIALVSFLLIATTSNILVLYAHHDKREIIWPIVWRLFIAAVPGLIIGGYVATHADKTLLQIIVGLAVIVAITIQEFAFLKSTMPLRVSRGISLSGFIAGLLNSSVGVSAPALVLWLRTHRCTPNQIRHNLAVIFMLMNVVSFGAIYVSKPSSLSLKPLYIFGALLPVAVLGNFVGQFVARRISRQQFERIMLAVVIMTGAMSIVLGITH